MKLYIWADPYKINYGSSLVFAVADNVDEAKAIAKQSKGYRYGKYDTQVPNVELGEPDRILELPCAEWHEWCE